MNFISHKKRETDIKKEKKKEEKERERKRKRNITMVFNNDDRNIFIY